MLWCKLINYQLICQLHFKVSPLIDSSPNKHRNYSPLQGQPESEVGGFSDSDKESEPAICPSLHTMLSPEQSRSQSLLGGPSPNEPLQGPPQGEPNTQDGNMQGIHQPHQPHIINPMMIGSLMNPGILAFPGMQQRTWISYHHRAYQIRI